MADKCYLTMSRVITPGLTLNYSSNWEKNCTYNQPQQFSLVFTEGEKVTYVTLNYDELLTMDDIIDNTLEVARCIPCKENQGD